MSIPRALTLFLISLITLITLVGASPANATPAGVPPDLQPWIDWVRAAHPEIDCPRAPTGAAGPCVWATSLHVEVADQVGSFALDARLYAEGELVLPGSIQTWPQAVTADGKPVAVAERLGRPVVRLAPGRHLVAGRLLWSRPPERLAVPDQTGIVTLTRAGGQIGRPTIAEGAIWLGEQRTADATTRDTLTVDVYRRIIDGVPLGMRTYVQLRAGGGRRIATLGRALLPGFEVTDFTSPLPARLNRAGDLELQLEPGEFSVEFGSRATGHPDRLAMQSNGPPWPVQEVWGFEAERPLRLVTLAGAPRIDLAQSGAPFGGEGFLMSADTTLELIETQRGDAVPVPNAFNLHRQFWVDFDGNGFIVRDVLDARMKSAARLSATYPLGRLAIDGRPGMVTTIDGGEPGVELQAGAHALEAVSTLPRGEPLAAVGWNVDAQTLYAELNLPPGWRLLWTRGVDRAPDAWLAGWTLWAVFLVVLTTVIAWRAFGRAFGLMTGLALVLVYQDQPAFGLAWLASIGLLALRALISAPRLGQIASAATAVALITTTWLAVTFAVEHARQAVYPQLERTEMSGGFAEDGLSERSYMESEAHTDELSKSAADAPTAARQVAASPTPPNEPARYPEGMEVQTGPGLPEWEWRHADLIWDGPVLAAQPMTLALLPPAATRLLSALMALAALAVTAALLLGLFRARHRLPLWARALVPAAALVLIVPGGDLAADPPGEYLLKELEARLIAPPACAPGCATIEAAQITITDETLVVRLDVHASALVAVPLPGRPEDWTPSRAAVDGRGAALTRTDGGLMVALDPGVHVLELAGPLAGMNRAELAFPLRPGVVRFGATGSWRVHGVREGWLPGGSLTLERSEAAAGSDAPALQAESAHPYTRYARTIAFGLEWRVQHRLERIAPRRGSISVRLPLLPGETVLDDALGVNDEGIVVVLAPDQGAREWVSTLPPGQAFSLTAPSIADRTEVWTLEPGELWHVDHAGVVPIRADDARGPRFVPLSGETLAVTATRTTATEGPTVTVERVEVTTRPGERMQLAELELTLRASRGGAYPAALPPDSEGASVRVGRREEPIPFETGVVTLPLVPGVTTYTVAWQSPDVGGIIYRTPELSLATEANNVTLVTEFPADRWVLLLGGPALGPALHYWGVNHVVLALGLVLARHEQQPHT
jgi:hypothetical protein